MTNFKPISLCNTLSKVINKLVVQKLRHIFEKRICPNQISFILRRQITDSIVIVQEMLNHFNRSKFKKGMIMWKIDLEKAYDRLSWSFIEDVLKEVGIFEKYRLLILNCVKVEHMQIVWNGELTNSFIHSIGTR